MVGLLCVSYAVALQLAPNLSEAERTRFIDTQADLLLFGAGWLVVVRRCLALAEYRQSRLARRLRVSGVHWVVPDVAALALALGALATVTGFFTPWRNFDVVGFALRSSTFWPIIGLVPGLTRLGLSTAGLATALAALVCAHMGMLGANFPLGSATVSTFDPSSARWLADGTAGIASLFVSLALARSRPN